MTNKMECEAFLVDSLFFFDMSKKPDKDWLMYAQNQGVFSLQEEERFNKHIDKLIEKMHESNNNGITSYMFYANLKYQQY